MSDLIPLLPQKFDHGQKDGVDVRDLYAFLGLNPNQWARWIQRNILKNPYAMEHIDWESFLPLPPVENSQPRGRAGRTTSEYVVSIDFAKRLAMMTRSAKGEEARQYFLECERRSQQLPQLHDPALQAIIHLTVDLDATKHKLQQVETQVARVLEEQAWMTIHQYVTLHNMQHQMPDSVQRAYATFLIGYCAQQNYRVYPQPVAYQRWENENAYYVGAINATLEGWLKRHNGQTTLNIVPKKGGA